MDVTDVLLDILVVLVAAKLAAEIAERINVPAVVAEIVAGVIIGPSVLRLVGSEDAWVLGGWVILLLLGWGWRWTSPSSPGRASMSVATVGVAADGGWLRRGDRDGYDGNQALFRAALATSVGITAVFSDLRAWQASPVLAPQSPTTSSAW